jgi:hypothetical protein
MTQLKTSCVLLFCLFALCISGLAGPPPAKAPVRGSSQNGTDNGAPSWNLLGPTAPITREGGTVTLAKQVVCTNQQVASAVDAVDAINNPDTATFADAGSCKDGAYTFLFQLQSTATNVTVTLHDLVGFTPSTAEPASTYGIETCDSDQNTLELCTDPNAPEIGNVTTTVNKKNTNIKFFIPSFPSGTPGLGNRGQGMTLVVVTQQPTALPVSFPGISIK